MKENEIIQVIEAKVHNYSLWTIGITDDPEKHRGEYDDPKYWKDWRANTETIARNVEKYFLNKGMKGDTGGGNIPNYVYIF